MSLPAIYFNFLLPQGCESFTVQHVLFKTLIELSVIEGPPQYTAGLFWCHAIVLQPPSYRRI